MAERLINQWKIDPNGERVVKIYEELGFIATLRGIFQPTRTVDVSSGDPTNFYEPFPLTLKANQRVEVIRGEKVVKNG